LVPLQECDDFAAQLAYFFQGACRHAEGFLDRPLMVVRKSSMLPALEVKEC